MKDQQRSSSNGSIIGPMFIFVCVIMFAVGSCQEMERNGTWTALADSMEEK